MTSSPVNGPHQELPNREHLWCQALLATLNPKDAERVLAWVNSHGYCARCDTSWTGAISTCPKCGVERQELKPLDVRTQLIGAQATVVGLKKSLRWALEALEATLGADEERVPSARRDWDVPRHHCECYSNPEKGACDFHDHWVTATDALEKS